MEIIRELEGTRRGLYTGAIGWIDAPQAGAALGELCLSVAIRTLALRAPGADGSRVGEMGVGAGIVHDSVAADEYAECLLKARFLTTLPSPFDLFETMRIEDGCCALAPSHAARMARSAAALGMPFDAAAFAAQVDAACAANTAGVFRLRIALHADGVFTAQVAPLPALSQEVVHLLLDDAPLSPHALFAHKTTMRARYNAGWQAAEAQGGFDTLFFNDAGQLLEGGRSSVFAKLDGKWWTPPLSLGILPGVMRAAVLAQPERYLDAPAAERPLTRHDVLRAEALCITNALRGVLRARLVAS
jgi:para-aminobenzoate synthetase/4-amino-4-deoxychorismate lyase